MYEVLETNGTTKCLLQSFDPGKCAAALHVGSLPKLILVISVVSLRISKIIPGGCGNTDTKPNKGLFVGNAADHHAPLQIVLRVEYADSQDARRLVARKRK